MEKVIINSKTINAFADELQDCTDFFYYPEDCTDFLTDYCVDSNCTTIDEVNAALHTSVTQAVGDFMFEVIDAEDLLQNIGKKNNTNPHKEFWDNCLTSVNSNV